MKKKIINIFLLLIFSNFFLVKDIKSNSKYVSNSLIPNDLSNKKFLKGDIYKLKVNRNNLKKLLSLLKKYDLKNAPKKNIIDGKIIYKYKRSLNEPKKTIKELENLIKNPEDTTKYEKFIIRSFLYLSTNGINIYIQELNSNGPSALWSHGNKSIFINKRSLENGTANFAYLLSHEMIHVSQSCKAGAFDAYPVLIGLNIFNPKEKYKKNLENVIYKDLTEEQIMLEIEAYANQEKLLNTIEIFKNFCLKLK